MTPTDQEVKAVLEAAKELIADEKDWAQGFAAEACGGGGFCMETAVEEVAEPEDIRMAAKEVLAEATGCAHAFRFNDQETTTHADVMAKFTAAIDSLSEDKKATGEFDWPDDSCNCPPHECFCGTDEETERLRRQEDAAEREFLEEENCKAQGRRRPKGSTPTQPAHVL